MSKPLRKNRSKKTDQVHEESLAIKNGVDELEQEGDGDYVMSPGPPRTVQT